MLATVSPLAHFSFVFQIPAASLLTFDPGKDEALTYLNRSWSLNMRRRAGNMRLVSEARRRGSAARSYQLMVQSAAAVKCIRQHAAAAAALSSCAKRWKGH